MTVYHFNTFLHGGAAIAARRIHESLRLAGVDSRFLHREDAPRAVSGASYLPFRPDPVRRTIAQRLEALYWRWRRPAISRQLSAHFRHEYEAFSLARLRCPTRFVPSRRGADIIHLHWIGLFLDYPTFFAGIPDAFPIVWTLHDMNALTGGCHYAWDCSRFKTGCRQCPQIEGARVDVAKWNWGVKWRALRRMNLHIVADSTWLEQQARQSRLLSGARSFRTIHYGVDTSTYRPLDKRAAREALGLPHDRFIVCFGMFDTAVRRKGGRELAAALAMLRNKENMLCLVFGQGGQPAWSGTPSVAYLGYVEQPEMLARVYSAADLLVMPSLQEAFGLTGLEAMACGTPVVGFRTGGIPDMIEDGGTGLLARAGDVGDLAAKMQWCVEQPRVLAGMGAAARRRVEEHFTVSRQAGEYAVLYATLTGGRAA